MKFSFRSFHEYESEHTHANVTMIWKGNHLQSSNLSEARNTSRDQGQGHKC